MRIEVCFKNPAIDGRTNRVASSFSGSGFEGTEGAAVIDVYLTDAERLSSSAEGILAVFFDPVVQRVTVNDPALNSIEGPWDCAVEVTYKPGVTNPEAITARKAVENFTGRSLSRDTVVQTARQYVFRKKGISRETAKALSLKLHNPLIQHAEIILREDWEKGVRFPSLYPSKVAPSPLRVESFDLSAMNDGELLGLSKTRLLALTLDEMRAVKGYFSAAETVKKRAALGLPRQATDVEIEMIAQTWSEHCKHKILNAEVLYEEDGRTERVSSPFKVYIRGTTEEAGRTKDYLCSVFHDNSGVIRFDEANLVCFKVETHNSPSALDPYGGAITGIVGVNRDILGTGKGAKPIFNTDVLCFGFPDTPPAEVPAGLIHPAEVMKGVHQGIIDGGNQSGIPVVAGGFVFDESYRGKPLVFCGTGGILPSKLQGEDSWIKHIDAGDLAVMIGGRIGKDGIHGATFSSLALDEASPVSAVQIGDPITQKRMTDFLLEARDLGLYKGITDNGAGGLSSSLGEMAEYSGGIIIRLDACPLKYQGLAPWEILVSESQERMSLAVDPGKLDQFMELSRRRDVEAAVVGEFTGSGLIEIFHGTDRVGSLDMDFLHHGLPVMELKARWKAPARRESSIGGRDLSSDILAVLSDWSVASKEPLVRQYDHEVQAGSVVKPFVGVRADAPSDGAVFRPVYASKRGLTITHGICQRYGDIDTYHMAAAAVDEAYRAHIALGGDPDLVSALDNICWPDPVESEKNPDGSYKMAQLVRALKGLKDVCVAYGIPLISGKDSMKNDADSGGVRISVRPTLLVSLIGIISDIHRALTTDFKQAGDIVFIAGTTRKELGASTFERVSGLEFAACPKVFTSESLPLYRRLSKAISAGLVSSCHDLADGGLAAALSESALGGRLGAEIDLDACPREGELSDWELLFSESQSRFVVSVSPCAVGDFIKLTEGLPVKPIGTVTERSEVRFLRGPKTAASCSLSGIERAFKRFEERG